MSLVNNKKVEWSHVGGIITKPRMGLNPNFSSVKPKNPEFVGKLTFPLGNQRIWHQNENLSPLLVKKPLPYHHAGFHRLT